MTERTTLAEWLDEVLVSRPLLVLKRLSGNDTLANGSHQAGPYIPKNVLFELFPNWQGRLHENQKGNIRFTLDSHNQQRDVVATWYNNQLQRGGTRNETRLTGFGGATCALLDPDSTGGLVAFCFLAASETGEVRCRAWLAENVRDETLIETLIGPVEPGQIVIQGQSGLFEKDEPQNERDPCWLTPDEIPDRWASKFPSGLEILEIVLSRIPADGLAPDKRLSRRRACEESAFYSIEEAVELERIVEGFDSIEAFMTKAKSMTQRRLSRSGRSLELHARQIFEEEGLHAGVDYSWQSTTENGKKPDFLFPSTKAYHDPEFPAENLRMLAVKTTCKDRWRQVINEADRIEMTHLLTLQEGVSINQFEEMKAARVVLVVPESNIKKFHKEIRKYLMTFGGFINEVRRLS